MVKLDRSNVITIVIQVLTCWCAFKQSKGQSYTISGSPLYAVKGGSYRFTCNIASNIPTAIKFIRGSQDACTIILVCNNCLPTVTDNRYQCTCNSNRQQLYINITDVTTADDAIWKCTDNQGGGSGNTVDLPVYFGPESVGLNPANIYPVIEGGDTTSVPSAATFADCGDPVAEGDAHVLTCHITGSLVVGINWFREGDINRIITCGCASKICISNNETLYSVNSTAHPDNKQQFIIKSVSAEDFTKKWICIDGYFYSDRTTAGTDCTLIKLSPTDSTPPTASTPPTDSTTPIVSTPITENTTPTTWIGWLIGCILAFIAGLCCGILGVLIYLKRLNLHCGHTKKNSDTATVTYDVAETGDVNNYDGLNMAESTDNPTSPVYVNRNTNSDHQPASNRDYINQTSNGGGSNPGHPPASSRDSINHTSSGGGSNPVNTYEHLTTAYTNENSYETL